MPQHLKHILERLQQVQHLSAIVLGGSYASGSHQPDSDIDLGLYYHTHAPLHIEQLRVLAAELNDTPQPVVTEIGGWGPWVNGGAWLTIQGQRVDLLYRDIEFVSNTLDDCNAGVVRSDYWQQPAYGFHSYIYAAETAICRPLYDPDQVLDGLKAKIGQYSPRMKETIIKRFLRSARFTLDNTAKAARRGEVYLVAGSLARAMHSLIQALYALNETYYLSEKRLTMDVESFTLVPEQMMARITAILGEVGTTSVQLEASLAVAEALYHEVAALCTA